MCAIAGYRGYGDKDKLQKMLLALEHRGPDDSGHFVEGEIGLGNNRLSIIDLSKKGRQPIFNEDNSICIVYNGELYNFKELRKTLEKKHKFKSKSDTEVILHAYEEWGVDCLQKLNGMFAFVIYDRGKNHLFGARDRLGEKPLKYYWDGKTFAFASEIKGLLPVLQNIPQIDEEAIKSYLAFHYVPAPKTGFKNIFKLPPATYFILKGNSLKVSKYWELDFSKKLNLKEEEWEELVFKKLDESVESRMVSDVPIGAFLSGGVDSSAVVALMAKRSSNKIKTFNIGFDDTEFDESKYAKTVADVYKTDHTTLIVTEKSMQDTLENIYDYYDEPFADNSLIPTLLLSQMTGKHVKVALSGDGGDENFAGYERHNLIDFGEKYKKAPRLLRNIIKIPAQVSPKTKLFANTLDLPFEEKYAHYNPYYFKSNEEMLTGYDDKLSDLDNALKFDINSYLPEDLLYKIDTASMSASLEVRAPFLNHELLELTAKMPGSLKIKNFQTKYLLKRILEKKKLLPRSIIHRKKRGFVMPVEKWLRGSMKDFVSSQLSTKKFQELGNFGNLKRIDKLNGHELFSYVSLSLWLERYF